MMMQESWQEMHLKLFFHELGKVEVLKKKMEKTTYKHFSHINCNRIFCYLSADYNIKFVVGVILSFSRQDEKIKRLFYCFWIIVFGT